MQCTCVRQTDLPNTSTLFADLIYHYDRVKDLYPWAPNDLDQIVQASSFEFPDARRAALVEALRPLNPGHPSLDILAKPGVVAVVTGQQVGLFSGPAYTFYKALTAIRIARELAAKGIEAVPVFWLATEDHDFAEVDHTWVFDAENRPVRIHMPSPEANGTRPVGNVPLTDIPLPLLRKSLAGLPFAEDAVALLERCWAPGETMGSAFARLIREIFGPSSIGGGMLVIDPLSPSIRAMAAPFMKEAVERMPELCDALIARRKELESRGYHAQVLVDAKTSLAFLLEAGHRIVLHRAPKGFISGHREWTPAELATRAEHLSPNALLRPVLQDYLLPTAAYAAGPAELAYFAQSQVLYQRLLGRQPVAFPRAGFTLLDQRSAKRMSKYQLNPADLMTRPGILRERIASCLVPHRLNETLDQTRDGVAKALDALGAELQRFDVSLESALKTSRRKIEYQVSKIARKTAAQMLAKDAQAARDADSLHGLVFPENHLQERLYSFIPLIAKFGPDLAERLYDHVRIECPDHQFAVVA
jgi:bacillithiol biosynthesis cysteine-adding enzyme BshC